jgi:FMN phosphatase YigB (HAD superfamily)
MYQNMMKYDLIKNLFGKVPLVIVTNGIGEVQQKRLLNSGLEP